MHTKDIEKADGSDSLNSRSTAYEADTSTSNASSDILKPERPSLWQRLRVGLKGGETRGIDHVPENERHPVTPSTTLHMFLMWFSMTLATNNIVVGSLGTFVMGLSFSDAAFCAVIGSLIGTSIVAYVGTWGPRSGARTLVSLQVLFAY